MIVTIFGGLLGIILICGMFCYILIKDSPKNAYYYDYGYLENKYGKWKIVVLFVFILSASIVILIVNKFILFMSNYAISSLGVSKFVIKPDLWFWVIPSGIVGLFITGIILYFITKILFKRNYNEINAFLNGGDDQDIGIMVVLVLIFSIGVAVFFTLGINWYTRFSDNSVIVNNYLSFKEEVHKYSDVNKIVEYDSFSYGDNKIENKFHIEIDFKDGYKWSSLGYGRSDYNQIYDKQIANYVSNRTGIKIDKQKVDTSQ